MIIEENEPIKVSIYYRKLGRGYIAYHEQAFKRNNLDPITKSKYKNINIWMKPLTWKLYNELQEESMAYDEDSNKKKFNYKLYKENKLLKLLLKWDAKITNDKGDLVDIELNEKNILNLSPDIAEAILEGYDAASLLSEEDEKKS